MNIEEILDQLDELIDRAWSLPLTGGRCVVDADKVRELLDDIRLNMPTEIRQAQSIVSDRTEIVNTAKKEAEAIVRRAETRAKALVEEEEVVRLSRAKAAEITQLAQQQSRETKRAAAEFVDNLLKTTETALTTSLAEVKNTRSAFHNQQQAQPAQQPAQNATQKK